MPYEGIPIVEQVSLVGSDYIPSKAQLKVNDIEDIADACRVFSTLRILQDLIGCEEFLDLSDEGVLLNCNSLDFVEELDYILKDDSEAEDAD